MASKIFLDTSPIIYFIEGSPQFGQKIKTYLQDAFLTGSQFVSSQISNTEFLTHPLKMNATTVISDYYNFRNLLKLDFTNINESISTIAAQLRAKYEHIKTMDALQLASCIYMSCDVFLTNDKQLKQITEVNVVLVENL